MTALVIESGLPVPDYACVSGLTQCRERPDSGVYLAWTDEGLFLCSAGNKARVSAEFAGGTARHRRIYGGGELLGKAVQCARQPWVWDATAGLGRDSFVLASLGAKVRAFERHAAVYALLADGLRRGLACGETAAVLQRIELCCADAAVSMRAVAAAEGRPDVVYLDPMYPERRKSAAVKKEMAYFHALFEGDGQDDEALLAAALSVAEQRVVVKRPVNGLFLCGRKPDYQYEGKSTRFDVYRP